MLVAVTEVNDGVAQIYIFFPIRFAIMGKNYSGEIFVIYEDGGSK